MSNESTIEISIVQLARKRTLMRSVEQGVFTLQAPPTDKMHIRDAPRMECASLKKMYNRSALAESVRGAPQLRSVLASDINDRSAPYIEEGLVIRFSERRAFLNALLIQVEKFYLRVLSTVSHIHHTSLETAIYVRENAPAKVHDLVEAGSHKMHDVYEAGRETAANTHSKASQALTKAKTGIRTNAQELIEASQEVAEEASNNAVELIEESATAIKDTAKDIKDTAKDVASRTSAFASAVADKFNQILVKGKNLLASDQEEILLKKRRPLRRAISEAAIYRAYSELLLEVEVNRQNLNHVLLSEIRDRSKPFIQSPEARQQNATKQTLQHRGAVLTEIKRSATCMTLNHVSIRDASRPVLPPSVSNLQSDSRKKLNSEIEEADLAQVLHATTAPTSDRSAPVLPFGDSVQLDKYESTKKSMLELVKAGVDLSSFSPRLMKDRSAPLVVTSPGLGSM